MVKGRKTWINRFPVCAMVYKEAAELIGYDKEEAKSLGLGRAIFFAAAKNRGYGAGGYHKGKSYEKRAEEQHKDLKGFDKDSMESLNFAGIASYVIHDNEGATRSFIGKPILPEDFDKQVKGKCTLSGGEIGYVGLRLYILKKLSKLSTGELNSGAVYKVYEGLRDKVREVEFLEEVSKKVEDSKDAGVPSKADIHLAKVAGA
jgi:hypothetical protein